MLDEPMKMQNFHVVFPNEFTEPYKRLFYYMGIKLKPIAPWK